WPVSWLGWWLRHIDTGIPTEVGLPCFQRNGWCTTTGRVGITIEAVVALVSDGELIAVRQDKVHDIVTRLQLIEEIEAIAIGHCGAQQRAIFTGSEQLDCDTSNASL